MRKIWMGLSTVVMALGLVACGGGGGGGGGDAGGGLEAVYDKVNAGTTYEEVNGMAGFAHNAGETVNPDNTTLYKWKAGEGAGQEILGVQFNNSTKKANFKVYIGGSKSRSTGL